MLYPLQFRPVYKNYIWGGRSLEKLGKELPEGIVAESWEVSCYPGFVSSVANGEYEGVLLSELIDAYSSRIMGKSLLRHNISSFPLLVKLIDANQWLSVQVHPNDEYALIHEGYQYGKCESMYVISAEPGAEFIYGLLPGTTKESFIQSIHSGNTGKCLRYIKVKQGDVINVPPGMIHAAGKGVVLAEIQQNSNITYRIHDYNRKDNNGNMRDLHIDKALDVIDFSINTESTISPGFKAFISPEFSKSYKTANKHFSLELYEVNGRVHESTKGERFHIFVFISGEAQLIYDRGSINVSMGQSILIPACLGKYELYGNFTAVKTYVPDLTRDIITPLREIGCPETHMQNIVKENV